MLKVFFSYSHCDEANRNELEKHLAILKRQGLIETWHDRRILAGSDLGNEIDQNLIESNLILLLVSPDFLASDYCYSKEMQYALEMRRQGKCWVIPIILEHCDWKNTLLKDLLACPQDGKPVSEYPNPNKAFHEITQEIRKVIDEIFEKLKPNSKSHTEDTKMYIGSDSMPIAVDNIRSGNLRIKKEFTDYEKDTFRNNAFEYIAKFFHNSLEELQRRNQDITFIYNKETNRFYVTIYRSGSDIAGCLIANRVGDDHWRGITYSYGKSVNSINVILNVEDDGYNLFLSGEGLWHSENSKKLSMKGAADYFWGLLIERLQQER